MTLSQEKRQALIVHSHRVLQCPVCSSEELTPETAYASFDTHARFVGMGGKGLLGGLQDLTVSASRCRVCIDCGHLILFVADSDKDRLQEIYRD